MANRVILSPLNMLINTIHKGTIAPMIAPNPLLMNFTPQVLSPLLKTKLSILRIMMLFHCFPFGQGVFLNKKKLRYKEPPINCLIPASCNAGMCLTPSLVANQVVPQKKLTQHKAKMGNPIALILDLKAVFIFVFNL